MYGKLENGQLIYAPPTLTINGMVHYHPNENLYEQLGYMEIIDTPYPEVDENNSEIIYYDFKYITQNNKIVKEWFAATPPEPTEPSLEDKLTSLRNQINTNSESITTIELALTELYEGV